MSLETEDNEYAGFFAEFYDVLHSGLRDAEAFVALGKRYGPDILELGSGTGRILIPLARSGCKVTGIERSPDMLSICRNKVERECGEARSRIELIEGDIRDFDIGREFDMVVAPCNVVNDLVTLSELRSALRCAGKHLRGSGVLVLDNSIPDLPSMVATSGREQVFEFTHPTKGTKLVDRFTATYDFVRQVEHDHIVIEEHGPEGVTRKAQCEVRMTYYFPRELKLIVESSGLEVFAESGSLAREVPVDDRSKEILLLCRKPRQNAGFR